jgi:hypothetical protein
MVVVVVADWKLTKQPFNTVRNADKALSVCAIMIATVFDRNAQIFDALTPLQKQIVDTVSTLNNHILCKSFAKDLGFRQTLFDVLSAVFRQLIVH